MEGVVIVGCHTGGRDKEEAVALLGDRFVFAFEPVIRLWPWLGCLSS